MIEYPVPVLLALSGQIMDLCERERLSADDIMQLRVRLMDPQPVGSVEMQIGFPRTLGSPAWQQLKQ